MENNYNVKMKVNGKWFTVGNIKTNPYGNLTLGIRVTSELRDAMVGMDGKWINFSLFEDDGQRKGDKPAPRQQEQAWQAAPLDDEIPF